ARCGCVGAGPPALPGRHRVRPQRRQPAEYPDRRLPRSLRRQAAGDHGLRAAAARRLRRSGDQHRRRHVRDHEPDRSHAGRRVLLYGLPYFGDRSQFARDAKWGVVAETPANSSLLREIFNDFCALGANVSDPTNFLYRYAEREGIATSDAQASDWRTYMELL